MIEDKTIGNRFTLLAGDCLDVLRDMAAESIDLTVTSPPYDALRTYTEGCVWNFEKFQGIALELTRVTKQGGVIVWVVGDQTVKGSETGTSFRQALYFKDECGMYLHDTMIYERSGKPLTHNRYEQHFEYMFVLSKGGPKTFRPIKDKPNKHAGCLIKNSTWRHHGGHLVAASGNGKKTISAFGMRGNIWKYEVGNGKSSKFKDAFKHPAIFPESLAADHIKTWSNPGDTVLDPFLGSGTTGAMAISLGRNFIGIEREPKYLEIAKSRIEASFHQSQQSLFGGNQ